MKSWNSSKTHHLPNKKRLWARWKTQRRNLRKLGISLKTLREIWHWNKMNRYWSQNNMKVIKWIGLESLKRWGENWNRHSWRSNHLSWILLLIMLVIGMLPLIWFCNLSWAFKRKTKRSMSCKLNSNKKCLSKFKPRSSWRWLSWRNPKRPLSRQPTLKHCSSKFRHSNRTSN